MASAKDLSASAFSTSKGEVWERKIYDFKTTPVN